MRNDRFCLKRDVPKIKAKNIAKIQETSNWQKDYMDTLVHYGLIKQSYNDYNANAKRWWIFSIVTATLKKEPEIKKEVGDDKQQFSMKIQRWYNKDKGVDVMNDFVDFLNKWY